MFLLCIHRNEVYTGEVPTDVTRSSLAEIVKIENTRISN